MFSNFTTTPASTELRYYTVTILIFFVFIWNVQTTSEKNQEMCVGDWHIYDEVSYVKIPVTRRLENERRGRVVNTPASY
jgi:hypothetical protein